MAIYVHGIFISSMGNHVRCGSCAWPVLLKYSAYKLFVKTTSNQVLLVALGSDMKKPSGGQGSPSVSVVSIISYVAVASPPDVPISSYCLSFVSAEYFLATSQFCKLGTNLNQREVRRKSGTWLPSFRNLLFRKGFS
jgi:hypothetical protein